MTGSHPEYNEYATCTVCGLKKYCRLIKRYYMCYSCDNKNFKGLRIVNNGTK